MLVLHTVLLAVFISYQLCLVFNPNHRNRADLCGTFFFTHFFYLLYGQTTVGPHLSVILNLSV